MVVSDQAALAMLNGPDTVRYCFLVSVAFEEPSDDERPIVTMIFAHGHGRKPRNIKLVFREVTEFGFLCEPDKPRVVAMFKCLQAENGDFFVCLDPDDERERFPSEKDGDFVRAKHMEVSVSADAAPAA